VNGLFLFARHVPPSAAFRFPKPPDAACQAADHQGATRDQTSQFVRRVSETLVSVTGKFPEHTQIVIQQIEDEN